jgi:glycosyltransferase involved in cell wall biosynthesis
MIRVGLVVLLRSEWQGGVNYFHNLLSSFRRNPDPHLQLVVFTEHPEDAAHYRSGAIEVHVWPGLAPRNFRNIPRRAFKRFLGRDPLLLSLLKRHRVDLLSHLSPQALFALGEQTSVPELLWMPDFQHKRLPHFFGSEECLSRDSFVEHSRQWGHILLSSHAAAGDFRRFFPTLQSVQPHVLHFCCPSILDVQPLSRAELETQYPVKEPYFYLPNQFWQHKNHTVVVEALRQTPKEIRVVCTGLMKDYRSPEYIPALMDKVKQAGIERRFETLGNVPYQTLVSLMHHSIAVLQPSLFEGWSTTVEEAKAMRKQILLSDIDVHREQSAERAVYFSPQSPEELAGCLRRSFAEFDPSTEEAFARERCTHESVLEQTWISDYARIIRKVAAGF